MKIRLINVGRSKVSKETDVIGYDGILAEVSKHLMSSFVELYETADNNKLDVVVGGMRTVGQVELLEITVADLIENSIQ